MAVNRTQVLELLGSGLSSEVVATAVGCTREYITQLLADESFAAEVANKRSETLTAHTKRDRNIDDIEDSLISKLEEAIDSNLIYKPTDILRAFAVVNAAKRRGVPAHESLTVSNQVVNLTIPQKVVQNFVVNSQGEVIEVEGQTLVTMPAHQLLRQLQANTLSTVDAGRDGSSDDNERYRKVANYLPGTIEQGIGS